MSAKRKTPAPCRFEKDAGVYKIYYDGIILSQHPSSWTCYRCLFRCSFCSHDIFKLKIILSLELLDSPHVGAILPACGP